MLCCGRVEPVMIGIRGLNSIVFSLDLVIARGGIVGAVMMVKHFPAGTSTPNSFMFSLNFAVAGLIVGIVTIGIHSLAKAVTYCSGEPICLVRWPSE